jgi:hypothetical protein
MTGEANFRYLDKYNSKIKMRRFLPSHFSAQAYKPGSVVGDHLSRTPVARHFMQPTQRGCGLHRSLSIRSCSRWGLPSRLVA